MRGGPISLHLCDACYTNLLNPSRAHSRKVSLTLSLCPTAAKFVTAPAPLPTPTSTLPRLGGRFGAQLRKSILHEAAVLQRLGPQAHIVQLVHVHEQGLILDRADTDLEQLIEQGRLERTKTPAIFRQVVAAVAHCHANGVYHLDIKPGNILVRHSGTGAPRVTLCDFGGSIQTSNPQQALTGTVGSIGYMAPEVLAAQSWIPGPVDCWALGVLLYVLLTSELPFECASSSCERFCQVSCGQIDFGILSHQGLCDRGAIDVLKMLWKIDPATRITSPLLLELDLIQAVNIPKQCCRNKGTNPASFECDLRARPGLLRRSS